MGNTNNQQPVVIIQANGPDTKRNGLGSAGFVLALLGLVFCWVPVLGWILWLLGFALSFAGLFKKPVGLAITGLILSIVSAIIITTLIQTIIELI